MTALYTRVSASIAHKKSRWLNCGRDTRNFPSNFGSFVESSSTSCGEINKSVKEYVSGSQTLVLPVKNGGEH
jgi:hypothetical protein